MAVAVVQHAAVIESPAFGPLTAALRRAEAYHHDLEALMPRVVARHGLDDADDIAAVLRYRVDKLAVTPPRGCRLRPRLVASLIPEPLGPMSAEDRQAIDQRKELIESRVRALAEDAVIADEPWTRRLGEPQIESPEWMRAAASVAAYRDRFGVTSDVPLGGRAVDETQKLARHYAQLAAREATRIATSPLVINTPRVPVAPWPTASPL